MSHFMFLLEYKIKIGFPSLGWENILQIIACAARLVPDSDWVSFLEKYVNALVFLVHYVKTIFLEQCTVFFSSFELVLAFTRLVSYLTPTRPPSQPPTQHPPLLRSVVSRIDFLMTIKTSQLEQSQ